MQKEVKSSLDKFHLLFGCPCQARKELACKRRNSELVFPTHVRVEIASVSDDSDFIRNRSSVDD